MKGIVPRKLIQLSTHLALASKFVLNGLFILKPHDDMQKSYFTLPAPEKLTNFPCKIDG